MPLSCRQGVDLLMGFFPLARPIVTRIGLSSCHPPKVLADGRTDLFSVGRALAGFRSQYSGSAVDWHSSDGTPDGPGREGHNEPSEVSSGQDKVVPEAEEDKRMWRKWIEERLTQGTAESSTVSKFKNPFRKESASSSILSDTALNKNSRTGDRRGSLFQESAKRSSFLSERQAANTAPQDDLDDFEYRVLGSKNDEDDSIDDDFLRDLDEIGRSVRGTTSERDENLDMADDEDWGDEKANVLTDLALSNMEVFDLEDEENPYRMRSDRLFFPGQTYDPEDLDLSKEAALEKPTVRTRKRYPSKEVFQVADFRNPRYLSKFIRESSRILPRRHFQISAKAQRKVAKEIKTARILGLMPFTSMGDPPFRFLRSRSEDDTNAGHGDY